jgi:hypothetical protein
MDMTRHLRRWLNDKALSRSGVVDAAAARGEAFLLGRSSLVTDADLRQLPGLEGLTLEQLLQLSGLPKPIAATPRARYFDRRAVLQWWRLYAAAQ